MSRLIPAVVLAFLASCGSKNQSCTIVDEGDGTSTISCPGSDTLRIPNNGTNIVCTVSDSTGGKRQILCSDGTAYTFDCHLDSDGKQLCLSTFPGGGSIQGNAQLFGLGGVAGIEVRAGNGMTTTDADGSFTLKGLDASVYDVTFAYPNYGTEVRHNIPSVGQPWKMDPVTLYPAWHLDTGSIVPSWAGMSPDESLLLAFTRFNGPAGPLTLWDMQTREPLTLTYDGSLPVAPAFRSDSSVVFVDALSDCGVRAQPDCGTIVLRAPDGTRRQHKGATSVRVFGDQILFVDSLGHLARWNPDSDSVRVVDSGPNNDLNTVVEVIPGVAMVYRPSVGLTWNLWVDDASSSGSVPFHSVPSGASCTVTSCAGPAVKAGAAVGILNGQFMYWTSGDKVRTGQDSNGAIESVIWADVAPDGQTAYFVAGPDTSQLVLYLARLAKHDMTALSTSAKCKPADGINQTFSNCRVLFSPDGGSLAYVEDANQAEGTGTRLRLVDAHSGQRKVKTSLDGGANELVFAGKALVYTVGDSPKSVLRLWKPDSDASTAADGTSLGLVASASGDHVLYNWALKDGIELRRLDVARGSSAVIADHVSPSYQLSPSGKTVAYLAVPPMAMAGAAGEAKLFRDGIAPVDLGPQGAFPQPLVWPASDESFLEIQPSVPPAFFDATRNMVWPLDGTGATVLDYSRKHIVYSGVDSAGIRTGLFIVYLPQE